MLQKYTYELTLQGNILPFSPDTFLIATVIVITGFGLFIAIASLRRKGSHRLFNFFVAGQTLPPSLAGQVYWGNSLALGNGIAFFATLTLFWGPAAFWVQIPWAIGMVLLGYLAPVIGRATKADTIHGFLGKQIGFGSRGLASIVTTFGFVLNLGFEVMIGALLIAYLLGSPSVIIPAIIVIAIFFAAYCNIGGYRANALTDRIQNIFGVIVVGGLVTYYWVFAPETIEQGRAEFVSSVFDFSGVPIWAFGGMCLYAFFVQFVDMSNWQNISATRLSGSDWKLRIRREFRTAALLSLIVPGALCVALAAPLMGREIADEVVVGELLRGAIPTDGIFAGLLWGGAMLALLGTMQSTADSFLMAATQTASWDLFDRKRVHTALSSYANDDEIIAGAADTTLPFIDYQGENTELSKANQLERLEYRITRMSRLALFPIAIVGSLSLYLIKVYLTEDIIQLMFLIFGSQLALVPATSIALIALVKGRAINPVAKPILFASILLGFVGGVGTIVFNTVFPGIVDFASYFALGTSSIIAGIGWLLTGGKILADKAE